VEAPLMITMNLVWGIILGALVAWAYHRFVAAR
jgi:hypothetical protein